MILSASNISVRKGDTDIVQQVSAVCRSGTVTVLLGPNGAGKTTVLRALAGLLKPTLGEATLGDVPLLQLSPRDRAQQIGFLPQAADIHWDIDVKTLVGLGRIAHQGWRGGLSAQDQAAIDEALLSTDVAQFANRPVRSLSGGERARVLLARMLAGQPRWLLADEPLAHLDLAHQFEVLDIFVRAAAKGCGVILVLHDLTQAARVADQVLLLSKGRMVMQGSPGDVLTAKVLSDVYDVNIDVAQHADGKLHILPLPRTIR
jgi:iron complex transport system ATP-binding protein